MTLPAFAAERRAAAPLLLGARRCRSLSPARMALSSKPAARRCCSWRTDGLTDARPFHRPCSARRCQWRDKRKTMTKINKTRMQVIAASPSAVRSAVIPEKKKNCIACKNLNVSQSCFTDCMEACSLCKYQYRLCLLTMSLTAHLGKFSISSLGDCWCALRNDCLQAEQTTAICIRKFLNKFSAINNVSCQIFVVNAKKELESC